NETNSKANLGFRTVLIANIENLHRIRAARWWHVSCAKQFRIKNLGGNCEKYFNQDYSGVFVNRIFYRRLFERSTTRWRKSPSNERSAGQLRCQCPRSQRSDKDRRRSGRKRSG